MLPMSDAALLPQSSARSLRLQTLVRLRWLAVIGQAATVLFVNLWLGFPLPIATCFALIALSALLNIVLRLRYPASYRLGAWSAFALLAYDVLQLSVLLYITGGLDNPFCILLLVPLIVSATAQEWRPTLALGILVVLVSSLLAVYHAPIPWHPGDTLNIPLIYSAGAWVALVFASAFTGIFTFNVAEDARRLAKALNATEMVLAREQHLSALDGLAAAAAHELGTPLATIALVVKELELDLAEDDPFRDDVLLLKSQVQRCRDIMAKLTSLSHEGDHPLARQRLTHLLGEVVEPFRAFSAEIVMDEPQGAGPEPVGRRNPAILHGLANFVENAVDFASERVTLGASWDGERVTLAIADDGPGFAPGIIDRIGEPYVTTRARSDDDRADHEAGGLGLGVFIAKTLLERTGATVSLANRDPPARGAVIRVSWPRAVFEGTSRAREGRETIAEATPWREKAEIL
ncbi:MAG: ActS/PrrB/RegB family redox-sensitive histidine kinase [Rhizobiales bacterium]|nr:ActS/PrrB/RegB family redox-sensitive histidine kinase [Hyphomicrobiales bacterium]